MGSNTDNPDVWKNFTPRQNPARPEGAVKPLHEPIDLNDPSALRNLAKSALVEIVQAAPRNVSLVAAIKELLDRVDGKAPQSISMDVKDTRLDKMPIERLLKLASMLDEPVLIAPPMVNSGQGDT